MPTSDEIMQFNGVNGATGDYGLSLSPDELTERILGVEYRRRQQERYREAAERTQRGPTRGVRAGVDPKDLRQTGWGVIFAFADPLVDEIREALQPLLQLRQQQAGQHFRLFTGPNAYRPGESKTDFLLRFGVGSGAVDPAKGVPYYLLLIGSPELIPYEFQYQLDVQFAVGRLDFDTLDGYSHYAQSVVAAENGQIQRSRRATFFGPANPDDGATAATHQYLVQPLSEAVTRQQPGWEIDSYLAASATRPQLEQLLGGAQTPALLFTASHGVEFPMGDVRQRPHQGALLCQEWPGSRAWRGELPEDFYFSGDHLASSANPGGMITFHFACYGGGTPQYYDFAHGDANERFAIAERPFVANLPKRLLGHARGGALAVVSHVDRAWSYSFRTGIGERTQAQTTVFESALLRLMEGGPLGWALEYFNERYAELATDLNQKIRMSASGIRFADPNQLARMWTETSDARNYVILGDPAVRLAIPMLPGDSTVTQTYVDGRPISVSIADWQQTPLSVKQVLADAQQRIKQLENQGAEAERLRQPVYRDGGRSRNAFSPAQPSGQEPVTRGGGVTRSGGFRSGIRGGAAEQPPTDEGDTPSGEQEPG
jgi:hypothetical protein